MISIAVVSIYYVVYLSLFIYVTGIPLFFILLEGLVRELQPDRAIASSHPRLVSHRSWCIVYVRF